MRQIPYLAERVKQDHGPVSVLVASAGIGGSNARVMDYDPGEWARVINTNLTGMFNTTRAAGFWKSRKLHP